MEKSDLEAKKIIDNLFDPEISEILSEMESGPKHCTFPVSYTHLTLPTKRIV